MGVVFEITCEICLNREFPVSEVTSYIELNQLETIDTPNVLTKVREI